MPHRGQLREFLWRGKREKGFSPPVGAQAETRQRPPLIWLGTNTCAGDLLSFMNSADPDYRDLITGLVDFRYNYLLQTAEGKRNLDVLREALTEYPGRYILVVEGTIPTRSRGLYAVIGDLDGRPLTALEAVQKLGAAARYVVAAGTCAAFGGPYAAAPNPSHSKPVSQVLDRKVINVPGCPVNPAWMTGTLAHLVWYGEPRMDEMNRPKMFYGETIHNLCQRRHYFENSIFAERIGEPWCMYRLGCKGPVTFADCPVRQWNAEHVSWPVKANTPCIGCASPEFPDGDEPFFEHLPDVQLPRAKMAADRVGRVTAVVTALGIGAHLAGSIITGRLPRTLRQGFGGNGGKWVEALRQMTLGKRGRP